MIDVYCVNVGTKYTREFDQKLKDSVAKHLTLEHTFTCVTDRPEKDYDKPVTHPELRGVFHKLSLLQFTGSCLFFDLDILINNNINFLASNFDGLTLVDSSPWKQQSLKEPLKFRVTQNTLVNSSIMRWSDQRHVFEKFIQRRDLYVRLYSGIDRYIYNEQVKYNYFMGDQISSWQEGVRHNTILLHNQKYV
jgi:hypothetical protein|tara:strand:- start:245 stop:820 length:576 start_codon:yes stop_codon:yes gene_type:complete